MIKIVEVFESEFVVYIIDKTVNIFAVGSFSGSGQGDMSEIPRLQAEIDERKQEIQQKNSEIEKLVSIVFLYSEFFLRKNLSYSKKKD